MSRSLAAAAALVTLGLAPALGCGGKAKPARVTEAAEPRATTAGEQLLALVPEGAQIVIELDVARLRGNAVVGALVDRVLDAGSPAQPLPEDVGGGAELVVLATYGLGTSEVATVMLVRSTQEVPHGTRVGEGVYALGPADWVAQIEARAALGADKLALPRELMALRDRAMPAAAPGAALRLTARLSFDARVALARVTGLESAPSQLSVWADVADDFAVIVDADAADPGEASPKRAAARLETTIRGALGVLGDDPRVRALGLTSSLAGAKLVVGGTWVRTIIAIGPRHLRRVVERAGALLPAAPASPTEPSGGAP